MNAINRRIFRRTRKPAVFQSFIRMVDETETSDSNFSSQNEISRDSHHCWILRTLLIKEIVEILKKKIETNLNFLLKKLDICEKTELYLHHWKIILFNVSRNEQINKKEKVQKTHNFMEQQWNNIKIKFLRSISSYCQSFIVSPNTSFEWKLITNKQRFWLITRINKKEAPYPFVSHLNK